MNDNFENSNEVPSLNNKRKNTEKRKIINKCYVCSILVLILVVACSLVFASSSMKSKSFYSTILNNLASKSRSSIENFSVMDTKAGKFTVEKINKEVEYEEIDKYEVTYDDNKYFISADNFKAIWDKTKNKIFVKAVNKEKENGDVLSIDADDSMYGYYKSPVKNVMSFLDDNYLSDIGELQDKTDMEGAQTKKDQLELCAIILETISKNLKDSYFIDNKSKGINEYTLLMNNEMVCELLENVIKDLNNNTKYLELAKIEKMDDEQLKYEIDYMKENIQEIKNLKICLSTFVKGNIKNFVGIKLDIAGELQEEKFVFTFDLNSKGKSPLKEFDNISGMVNFEYDDTKFNANLDFTKKSLKASGNIKYTENHYDYSSFGQTYLDDDYFNRKLIEEVVESSFNFEIITEDNKEFLKSSEIKAKLDVSLNDEKHHMYITIKGNSKNSMFASTKISVSADIDDEKVEDVVVLYAEDNKPFKDSSKLVLSMQIDDNNFKLILEAKDNKALKNSSQVALRVESGEDKLELVTLKANDNKELIKSSDVSLILNKEMYDGEYEFNVKALDNKALIESSNLEFKVKGEFDYSYVDFILSIKGDTKLINAKKLEVSFNGILNSEIVSIDLILESLENKAIRESKKFEGKIYLKVDEAENGLVLKFDFNSEKGYQSEKAEKYNNSEEIIKIKYEKLNSVNFDNLLNTKNAKEGKEDDVLRIINPTASFDVFSS